MLRETYRQGFHVRGTGPDAAVGVSEVRDDVLAQAGRAGDQLGGAGRCDGVQAVIHLNYRRRVRSEDGLGRKEREYQYGTVTVNGVAFTDAWLIRTGKNGVVKRSVTDANGIFVLNRSRTGVVEEVHRGRVKVRNKQ